MDPKKNFKLTNTVLAYYIVAITLISAGIFFFMFIINWEDRFWGIKLDGLSAGIYLFSKGAIALLLALLVLKYRAKLEYLTFCAIVYFVYLVGPGLFTRQLTLYGTIQYVSQFCIVILVPIILLILHEITRWKYKNEISKTE